MESSGDVFGTYLPVRIEGADQLTRGEVRSHSHSRDVSFTVSALEADSLIRIKYIAAIIFFLVLWINFLRHF
jgi:hypothetical protein